MLYPRIIPCLLVKNKGLVKTVNFTNPKYVGDPINAVRIFNEKEADELIVLDIGATPEKKEPDYKMIEYLAAECRMPLCYGGGITNIDQVLRIIRLGVEKVAMGSAAMKNPDFLAEAARCIGSQSLAVIIDVKKSPENGKYDVYTHNGRRNTGKCPLAFALQAQELGAGEIIVNSIDKDGHMGGYDLALAEKIHNSIAVPLTVLGGAGSLADIGRLINKFGTIGAAAGSLFVFKGVYRAVLLNYPSRAEKHALIKENLVNGRSIKGNKRDHAQ
jgi:cyclase